MTVASSETEIFKDKVEVSLDGRQIFYLFFGGAVIATLVFVLGVMVGRRVESRSIAEAGSPVTDPLAALDQLEAGSELAFPAALRGAEVSLGTVDATLKSRVKPLKLRVAVGSPAEKKEAAPEPHKAVASAKETSNKDSAKPQPVAETVAESTEEADKKKATTKTETSAKAEVKVAKATKRRRFTLQVGSFQDKEEANQFFRDLAKTSYDPYMVEADVPGKGHYFRVRVGGYGSFDEAVAAKTLFEDKQHVIAYVTRLK